MMLFINKMFILLYFEDYILHENVNFQPLFVVVKMNGLKAEITSNINIAWKKLQL